MGEPMKKIKPLSIILWVVAAILGVAAIFFMFFGNAVSKAEDDREPIDVYYATEQDEPAYLLLQYMTESVAYLEAVESMQYYITFDSDWNAAVICLYGSELANYQKYIDWLYSTETENGPEEIQVNGYSVPYDEDLKQFVIEGFNDTFGAELITEQNFEDYFGKCYLTIGQNGGNYEKFNLGIYCMLGAVIFVILGVVVSYKSIQTTEDEKAGNYLEARTVHRGRGVLGALLGALLGGVLWAAVGALGYISGWIGVLIVLFAKTGYKLFAKEKSGFGTAVSLIFSLLVVLPATYFAGVWMFYQDLNENISGYVTLGRALTGYGEYLTKTDNWGSMIHSIVMGYVFMLVAGCYGALGVARNQKQEPSKVAEYSNVNLCSQDEEREDD